MADKLTKPQLRLLKGMYAHPGKRPFSYEVRSYGLRPFQSAKAGNGSYANMVVRLCNDGFLTVYIDKPGVGGQYEITAKGLFAIGAPYAEEQARKELERERAQAKLSVHTEQQANLAAAFERRKAKIIAKVREAWPGRCNDWTDAGVWQLITSIVEIERTT